MAAFTYTAPTVGGSADTWGTTLNTNWSNLSTFLGSLDSAELAVLDGITATTAELNILDGVTATAAELNILDGVTATAAELNILDGVTATAAELNYVDGVTSAIQTQLDAKAAATTQAEADWEAGTSTTESVVSPAKVKASIIANAPTLDFQTPVATTSGAFVDFDSIPSTATEVNIYLVNTEMTGSIRVQLKVGGTAITTGYAASSGTSSSNYSATDGFNVYNDYPNTRLHRGIITLARISSGTWVESHSVSLSAQHAAGGGAILGVGTVDGIRVAATGNSGSGVFTAGQVSVSWR